LILRTMEKQKAEEYLKNIVHPILEKLVVDLLINRPQEPLQFMQNWINTKIEEDKPQKPH
jgi:hypothetical protein